jgi:hypothetical protein
MVNKEKKYIDGDRVGTTKMSWDIPEFQDYTRGKKWYIIAIIIGLLLLIYSIFSANLLFGMIIIIAAVTLIRIDKSKPETINFSITTKGLIIGDSFYEYVDIQHFYIIYEPPKVKNLFIEPKSFIKPRINIPLFDNDPTAIRALLIKYVSENLENENEPLSESLGRIFKL